MSAMVKTLIGLFCDDGSLAVGIAILIVSVALLAKTVLFSIPLAVMVTLVAGTVVVLLENVVRTARRTRAFR